MKRLMRRHANRFWIAAGLLLTAASACQFESMPAGHSDASEEPSSQDWDTSDRAASPMSHNVYARTRSHTETLPVALPEPPVAERSSGESLSREGENPRAVPQVLMSAAHRQECLVFQGDRFPEMSLLTADGRSISSDVVLAGQSSLVVFWRHEQLASVALQEYLASFSKAYPAVRIVTIRVGDGATDRQRDLRAPDIQRFVDPSGQAFAKVATIRLPRTYLLDANLKIVWLDTEFSRSMRRELHEALDSLLVK